MIAKIIKIYRV